MSQSNQTPESVKRESYWVRIFASLGYRDFRLVWLGSVTEHIGQFMQVAAILWLVNKMTHSALMLTIVGSSRFVPLIFLPLVSGVVADRVNRRSLLIASLLGASLLSIILTLLVMTDAITLWHLIVINILGGVLTSFNHPARSAIVPNLVKKEHLLNAISLDSISVQGSRMVGMLIVGYLIVTSMATFGNVGPIFALRALGALLAIFWLVQARIPPTPPIARTQTPWHNLTEGFRYLRSNTVILVLLTLFLIPMLTQRVYTDFMPIFAEDILHVGAVGYGYLQAAPGLGALIALVVLTVLTYYRGKVKLLLGASAFLGISLISFSASRLVFLSLPLLVAVGGMATFFTITNTTLVQSSIPDEMRGRVMSWREVARGIGPTGGILFGAIAQYIGVPFSLGLQGGICLIASLLILYLMPKLKSAG